MKKEDTNERLRRELDFNRVHIWRFLNLAIGFLVPLQIVGRFIYVHMSLAQSGKVSPLTLDSWLFIGLGVMSLPAGLAYSWRNIRIGTILGLVASTIGVICFGYNAYCQFLKQQWGWFLLFTIVGNSYCIWLYCRQMWFILHKYKKGEIGA